MLVSGCVVPLPVLRLEYLTLSAVLLVFLLYCSSESVTVLCVIDCWSTSLSVDHSSVINW